MTKAAKEVVEPEPLPKMDTSGNDYSNGYDNRSHESSRGYGAECYNCHQTGHIARACPEAPKRVMSGACHKCGKEGHWARDCPDAALCYNCQQSGHLARDCTNARVERKSNRSCYNCNQEGHLARDCPYVFFLDSIEILRPVMGNGADHTALDLQNATSAVALVTLPANVGMRKFQQF